MGNKLTLLSLTLTSVIADYPTRLARQYTSAGCFPNNQDQCNVEPEYVLVDNSGTQVAFDQYSLSNYPNADAITFERAHEVCASIGSTLATPKTFSQYTNAWFTFYNLYTYYQNSAYGAWIGLKLYKQDTTNHTYQWDDGSLMELQTVHFEHDASDNSWHRNFLVNDIYGWGSDQFTPWAIGEPNHGGDGTDWNAWEQCVMLDAKYLSTTKDINEGIFNDHYCNVTNNDKYRYDRYAAFALCNNPKYSNGLCKCQCSSCTVFGDPHYITFDGFYHHFQGTQCSYAYVTPCMNNHTLVPYDVIGVHGSCPSSTSVYRCIKSVYINFYNKNGVLQKIIKLANSSDSTTKVYDVSFYPLTGIITTQNPTTLVSYDTKVDIDTANGYYYYVTSDSSDIYIYAYTGSSSNHSLLVTIGKSLGSSIHGLGAAMNVRLASCYLGLTCGLCAGRWDIYPENDFHCDGATKVYSNYSSQSSTDINMRTTFLNVIYNPTVENFFECWRYSNEDPTSCIEVSADIVVSTPVPSTSICTDDCSTYVNSWCTCTNSVYSNHTDMLTTSCQFDYQQYVNSLSSTTNLNCTSTFSSFIRSYLADTCCSACTCPTVAPTPSPTGGSTTTLSPTSLPTPIPTSIPTQAPTLTIHSPTQAPTTTTHSPTPAPTTFSPTQAPTTHSPTPNPTLKPTQSPAKVVADDTYVDASNSDSGSYENSTNSDSSNLDNSTNSDSSNDSSNSDSDSDWAQNSKWSKWIYKYSRSSSDSSSSSSSSSSSLSSSGWWRR